jgi:hypothetical protein
MMEKIENALSHPVIGAGAPIAGAGIAEFCNNIIPFLSFFSLSIGILVGCISLYFNIKRLKKSFEK